VYFFVRAASRFRFEKMATEGKYFSPGKKGAIRMEWVLLLFRKPSFETRHWISFGRAVSGYCHMFSLWSESFSAVESCDSVSHSGFLFLIR
jgi:hypothetical protein